MEKFNQSIFEIDNFSQFEQVCLETFQYQYANVKIYQQFAKLLRVNPNSVTKVSEIPFLPISFFKSHKIISNHLSWEVDFQSSGTTGMERSQHYVHNLELYSTSFTKAFERQYGAIKDYTILALLPSYMEQGQSSLVYMVDHLIHASGNPQSGFYLNNYADLVNQLNQLEKEGKKTILLGVSYALLDIIESHSFQLQHTIVMETGGMKGRRKEMIKEELHAVLKQGFGVSEIHSEYGMTELLSQAYSTGHGVFNTPPWMKVLVRDATDPLTYVNKGITGGINVIDLANQFSCAFIATQDLGKKINEWEFEIMGRFDHSDVRGCNLLLA